MAEGTTVLYRKLDQLQSNYAKAYEAGDYAEAGRLLDEIRSLQEEMRTGFVYVGAHRRRGIPVNRYIRRV